MLNPSNLDFRHLGNRLTDKLWLVHLLVLFLLSTSPACVQKDSEIPYYKKIPNEKPLAPGKAAIKGTVLWNRQPATDVKIWLCEDASTGFLTRGFECRGKVAETQPDEAGVYWFTDLDPKSFVPVIVVPGPRPAYFFMQKLISIPIAQSVFLHPNETVEVKVFEIYRSDIKIIGPKDGEKITERRPALNWESYPGAEKYSLFLYNDAGKSTIKLDSDGPGAKPVEDLPTGKYSWRLTIYGQKYTRIAETDSVTFEVVDQLPRNTNSKPKKK